MEVKISFIRKTKDQGSPMPMRIKLTGTRKRNSPEASASSSEGSMKKQERSFRRMADVPIFLQILKDIKLLKAIAEDS